MGEAFKHWYKFRDLGNQGMSVFLQCVNGCWACMVGYNWENAQVDRDMNRAIRKAIKEYADYSG